MMDRGDRSEDVLQASGQEASGGQGQVTDQSVETMGAVPLGSRWTFWCDT